MRGLPIHGSPFLFPEPSMSDDLLSLKAEAEAAIAAASDPRALDAVRVAFMGKQGRITGLLRSLGQVAPEERKARGGR
jgi:phenylalanyl-tRNA synthetase alpha chain